MEQLPLIYSCSGCSNVAQLANAVALHLDDQCQAEMSCIAGVGGNIKPLVNKAKSKRKIIAIDGCPLSCCKGCLSQHGLSADVHIELSKHNFKKRYKTKFSTSDLYEAIKLVEDLISSSD